MIAPGLPNCPPIRLSASLALLFASALCLAACAAAPSGTAVSSYSTALAGAGVDGQGTLASLSAAAGRTVAVRRISYANGFGQEIVLDGPRAMSGENLVTVQVLTTARTALLGQGAEELRLGRPTDTEIAADMDRALPGMAMHIAPAPERDEEGTVGYATGTMGRLSCVYAWQYLEPARPLSLLEGAAGTGAFRISVRVRLCREQPMAALVELLRSLRVSRPEGSAELSAIRPLPSGDALTAAIGSPLPSDGWNRTDADPASSEAVRPIRSRGRHLSAARHRAAQFDKVRLRAPRRHARELSADPTGLMRVPMPDDVTTSARQPRILPASAERAAAANTGMPMPR